MTAPAGTAAGAARRSRRCRWIGSCPTATRFSSKCCTRPRARAAAGLSVFFPAYNDSGTIASMVIRAVQAASPLTPDYEVIVVNDGSVDATPQIIDELARTYPRVRAVHHPRNRGYGGALQTG